MQKWVIALLIAALKAILADEELRDKLVDIFKKILGGVIAEKVLPLLPTAIASAVDAVIKKLPGVPNLDPGQVLEVAEHAKDSILDVVDKAVPDFDTGIKQLDDLMDFWRPKA